MIRYVIGDATDPQSPGRRIVAHICNDGGGWGKGFVLAVSSRWPEPEAEYRRWFRFGPPSFRLGEIQLVMVEPAPLTWVANMIAQVRRDERGHPIRYDALRKCLARLSERARDLSASIHLPRIGCGLAGGNWASVGPIVEKELAGVNVTVYDLG